MAKFCQNCKKTYTDENATFCEDCGGDLVAFDGTPVEHTRGGGHTDGFLEEPARPLWKKYLPYGAAGAILAIFFAVVPGLIRDDVVSNIKATIGDNLASTIVQGEPKFPVNLTNNSAFGLTLAGVTFGGSVLGVAVRAPCANQDLPPQEIPKGTTTRVEFPLCTTLASLKGADTDIDGSSVSGSVTFKIFGLTVTHPFSLTLDDVILRSSLKIKERRVVIDTDPVDDHKAKRKSSPVGGTTTKPCELLDVKTNTCLDQTINSKGIGDQVKKAGQKAADFFKGTEKNP